MTEIWKPVVGYEGKYEVSNLGRVRAVVYRIKCLVRDNKGRQFVALQSGNRKKRALVHRLVLQAFVGECPPGQEACHNNGKAFDNRVENLRWDSHQSNMNDQVRHGTRRKAEGEENGQSKLTEEGVMQIYHSEQPQAALAACFGIHQSTVSNIKHGKSWSWLTGIKKGAS